MKSWTKTTRKDPTTRAGTEPVKASEEGKGGICGPTVVVLLSMMALFFRKKKPLNHLLVWVRQQTPSNFNSIKS